MASFCEIINKGLPDVRSGELLLEHIGSWSQKTLRGDNLLEIYRFHYLTWHELYQDELHQNNRK